MATLMPSVLFFESLLYRKKYFNKNDVVGNLVDETRKLNRRMTLKCVHAKYAKNVL